MVGRRLLYQLLFPVDVLGSQSVVDQNREAFEFNTSDGVPASLRVFEGHSRGGIPALRLNEQKHLALTSFFLDVGGPVPFNMDFEVLPWELGKCEKQPHHKMPNRTLHLRSRGGTHPEMRRHCIEHGQSEKAQRNRLEFGAKSFHMFLNEPKVVREQLECQHDLAQTWARRTLQHH